MYNLTVSMAIAKQPEAIKCVAYENSSPWYILKSKPLQKSTLCICNDMLIKLYKYEKGFIFITIRNIGTIVLKINTFLSISLINYSKSTNLVSN